MFKLFHTPGLQNIRTISLKVLQEKLEDDDVYLSLRVNTMQLTEM